jgi:hypothetical protein
MLVHLSKEQERCLLECLLQVYDMEVGNIEIIQVRHTGANSSSFERIRQYQSWLSKLPQQKSIWA